MIIERTVDAQGNLLAEEVIEEQSPWMTIQEAAKYLRVSDHTIHEYHRTRRPDGRRVLEKHRIGGFQTIRVRRADVEALVKPVGDEVTSTE
jgi:excisionase family DNA binding protein